MNQEQSNSEVGGNREWSRAARRDNQDYGLDLREDIPSDEETILAFNEWAERFYEERAPWADFVGYPEGDLVEVYPNDWFDGPHGLEFERSSGGHSYASAIEGN